MTIAVLVITDGRDDYLGHCVASLDRLHGDIVEWWMFDDTGDDAYRAELARRHRRFELVHDGPRRGCAGAFAAARAHLRDHSQADHLVTIEQDFVLLRDIPLDDMAGLLDDRPHLVQVALRRQAWNGDERRHGGVVESNPTQYLDMADDHGRQWLEHRLFYTTNPGIERASLLQIPWPAHRSGAFSEGTWHQRLLAEGTPEAPGHQIAYAYWGARDSGVWVEHIGHRRAGTGY